LKQRKKVEKRVLGFFWGRERKRERAERIIEFCCLERVVFVNPYNMNFP